MVKLYADEGFPRRVSELLRELGHDVLTVQEAGQANQKISDKQVLAFATQSDRAVLRVNRADFIRLHQQNASHAGIIVCTEDRDRQRLAHRINQAILNAAPLAGQLIRVSRPQL